MSGSEVKNSAFEGAEAPAIVVSPARRVKTPSDSSRRMGLSPHGRVTSGRRKTRSSVHGTPSPRTPGHGSVFVPRSSHGTPVSQTPGARTRFRRTPDVSRSIFEEYAEQKREKRKQTVFAVDQEDMSEQIIQLKRQNQALEGEMRSLKADVVRKDREIRRNSRQIEDVLRTKSVVDVGSDKMLERRRMENRSLLVQKKRTTELEHELRETRGELKTLKSDVRYTRVAEIEMELKTYFNECRRLRRLLEEGRPDQRLSTPSGMGPRIKPPESVVSEDNYTEIETDTVAPPEESAGGIQRFDATESAIAEDRVQELEERNAELEAKIHEIRNRNGALAMELEGRGRVRGELEDIIKTKDHDIETLTLKLQASETECTRLQKIVTEYKKDLESLKTGSDDFCQKLQSQLEEKTQAEVAMKSAVDEVSKERTRLKEEVSYLSSVVDTQAKDIERENIRRQLEVSEVKASGDEKDQSLQRLKAAHKTELADVSRRLEKKREDEINALSRRLEAQKRSEAEAARQTLEESKGETEILKHRLEATKSELAGQKDASNRLAKANTSAENRATAAETALVKAQHELLLLRQRVQQMDTVNRSLEENVRTLKSSSTARMSAIPKDTHPPGTSSLSKSRAPPDGGTGEATAVPGPRDILLVAPVEKAVPEPQKESNPSLVTNKSNASSEDASLKYAELANQSTKSLIGSAGSVQRSTHSRSQNQERARSPGRLDHVSEATEPSRAPLPVPTDALALEDSTQVDTIDAILSESDREVEHDEELEDGDFEFDSEGEEEVASAPFRRTQTELNAHPNRAGPNVAPSARSYSQGELGPRQLPAPSKLRVEDNTDTKTAAEKPEEKIVPDKNSPQDKHLKDEEDLEEASSPTAILSEIGLLSRESFQITSEADDIASEIDDEIASRMSRITEDGDEEEVMRVGMGDGLFDGKLQFQELPEIDEDAYL